MSTPRSDARPHVDLFAAGTYAINGLLRHVPVAVGAAAGVAAFAAVEQFLPGSSAAVRDTAYAHEHLQTAVALLFGPARDASGIADLAVAGAAKAAAVFEDHRDLVALLGGIPGGFVAARAVSNLGRQRGLNRHMPDPRPITRARSLDVFEARIRNALVEVTGCVLPDGPGGVDRRAPRHLYGRSFPEQGLVVYNAWVEKAIERHLAGLDWHPTRLRESALATGVILKETLRQLQSGPAFLPYAPESLARAFVSYGGVALATTTLSHRVLGLARIDQRLQDHAFDAVHDSIEAVAFATVLDAITRMSHGSHHTTLHRFVAHGLGEGAWRDALADVAEMQEKPLPDPHLDAILRTMFQVGVELRASIPFGFGPLPAGNSAIHETGRAIGGTMLQQLLLHLQMSGIHVPKIVPSVTPINAFVGADGPDVDGLIAGTTADVSGPTTA